VTLLATIAGQWRRIALYAVLAAMLLGAAWLHGYSHGELLLANYRASQAVAAVRMIVKQGEATERVVTRYVKVKGDTEIVTRTVEKEVVRYAQANPGPCLDAAWRVLHDAAASNAVPGTAGRADGILRTTGAAAGGLGLGLGLTFRGRSAGDGDGQLRPPSPMR
jgi:hypothetical protein